ncbi:MAG: ferric reductase [Litoreibacter sp.]|uniref:ferric reductase n=1 Tax=Litoreibacter sp. TaxID=1969459 RepID=UPI0032983D22
MAVPIGAAALSPFLAWRGPIYIFAGFAGIFAMALLLIQPLLVAGYLPGFEARRGRGAHGVIGGALVLCVVGHVAGLWITSPPDVIDALTFTSPTSFSVWGVVAMWAVFTTALVAKGRRRLRLKPHTWRGLHLGLAVVIALGSTLHALLIEGAMETITKAALCALVLVAVAKVVLVFRPRRR